MTKFRLGALLGLALGTLDGASAWLSPEARPTFWAILLGAAVKGLATGAVVGWLATRLDGTAKLVAIGALVGAAFSVPPAISTGTYAAIVLPGTVIGAIVGGIVARHPGVPAAGGSGSGQAVG